MVKLNITDKDELLYKASKDLILFGKLFLPNDFLHKSESPPFHYDLGKKLISTKPGARICNVLPRGFGKSVLMKAAIMHKLCYGNKDEPQFMAWVAEEQGQSIDHLKYIRSHLENNDAIRYYFGNMCGGDTGKRWTEKDLVTNKGHRIIAKGTSQRLRGRSEVDVRYTGIILDDFESELNTKTAIRRDEIKQWIVSTVYPALEESPGQEGWIWLSGTIVHYDAFLQNIYDGWQESIKSKKEYTWDVTFIKAIEDGKATWAEQFSLKKLKIKRQEFIEAGKIDKFAQEYMNDARDSESATFQMDKIKYHNYEFFSDGQFCYLKNNEEMIPIYVYLGVDLAHTATRTSDYQAIMVMGIDANKNRYIIDYYHDKIPAFDMPEQIIKIAKKYAPVRRCSVETVGAQEMVRDMVERMVRKEKRLLPGINLGVRPPHGIKKEDRLEMSLGSIVNSKKLYVRRTHTELIDELFQFPKGRNDDLLDALYYSDFFAKPPRSTTIKNEEYENIDDMLPRVRTKINWVTGLKI
jgi:phage terminase large subunit-like protein